MDVFSRKRRSEIMSRVRTKGTAPELMVRRLLYRLGFRFRLQRKDLPGNPDIVLPKYRTVVFVHGCLWHGHDCPRGKRPTSNTEFWEKKINGNIQRDSRAVRDLGTLGWRSLIIWQCQLKDLERLTSVLNNIKQAT
jgi:DNA mismatch endonuclease (patch repair protein)